MGRTKFPEDAENARRENLKGNLQGGCRAPRRGAIGGIRKGLGLGGDSVGIAYSGSKIYRSSKEDYKSFAFQAKQKAESKRPKFLKGKKLVEQRGEKIYLTNLPIKAIVERWCKDSRLTQHKYPIRYRCAYLLQSMAEGKFLAALRACYGKGRVGLKEDLLHKPIGITGVEKMVSQYRSKLFDPAYVRPKNMQTKLDMAIYDPALNYSALIKHGRELPLKKKRSDPIAMEDDVDIRMGADVFLKRYARISDRKDDMDTRKAVLKLARELIAEFRSSESLIATGIEDGEEVMKEYARYLNEASAYAYPGSLGLGSGWWDSFAKNVLHLVKED